MFRIRILRNGIRQVVEVFLRDAAGFFYQLRGITRIMALENLENRIRMLQGVIALDIPGGTFRFLHVLPRIGHVRAGFRVIARKQSVQFLGVLVILRDDHRRIGIRDHIIAEIQLILEHVVDNSAQQHHVGTAANANVAVSKRRGTRIPRIHVNNAGTTLFGFHDPLESHRVAFSHIRTLDDDAISIRHILQRLGCAAAAKRSS